jgi:hypothetical protein
LVSLHAYIEIHGQQNKPKYKKIKKGSYEYIGVATQFKVSCRGADILGPNVNSALNTAM